MIRKFFLTAKISIKGGFDMKYFTLALKYLLKTVECLTIIDPVIRGLISIWTKTKKTK